MNYKHHLHPDRLEKYSFLWSEARLVIAAVALLIGGTPPLVAAAFALGLPLFGVIRPILTVAWLLSGGASAYLLYRWFKGGQRVFGGKDKRDTAAFFVSVVSGINLGLAGLLSNNLGMKIFNGYGFWILAGLAYLVSAWHLWRRWKAHGEKVVS